MTRSKSRTTTKTRDRSRVKIPQYGLGMNVFHGSRVQRGYGLGNILGGLFRRALPFLWQGAKYAGKAALKTGIDVANDVMDGHDMKASIKTRTKSLGKELGGNVVAGVTRRMNAQTGRGQKVATKRLSTKQATTLRRGSKQKRSTQSALNCKATTSRKQASSGGEKKRDIFGNF